MENMRFKVGDRIRIKSLDWYNENKDEHGNIDINHNFTFYADRRKYCGKVVTISEVFDIGYSVKEDNHEYYWADEMFEGLVEEEVDLIPKFGEYSDNEPLDMPTMTTEFIKEHGLPCPNGYIFKDENGNVINATKIVLEKKKKEYPKTYEECCEILEDVADCSLSCFACGVLNNLQKLLLCRAAYWKIAGEEMGLETPWEPDYTNTNEKKFAIWFDFGEIKLGGAFTTTQMLLSFPTAEMRDAFKENFDPDIKKCKMFL